MSAPEQDRPSTLAARPKIAPALAQRARIVLRCAEGMSNTQVAQDLRITVQTVGKWRRRFLRLRLAGLADAPRSGAPRTISDAKVEHVVTLTLERKPAHATHWSTCSLAKCCGLTLDVVHRIWRAFFEAAPPTNDQNPKSITLSARSQLTATGENQDGESRL